jgi:type I pantothenate kinase
VSEAGYDALATIVRDRVTASDQRPYLVAVTGGVAAGKSTVAEELRAQLADRWTVAVVSTDGFLFPNAELDRRGLAGRKGYPETYDLERLARFLRDARAGTEVRVPVYSHVTYDIVPGEPQVVPRTDVLIVEGLPVLQPEVADSFDLSIYVDADEADLERWYVERFLALREAAHDDEASFFHGFVALSEAETAAIAREVWRTINGPNTRDEVLPTRERADVIAEKGSDHEVRAVRLRGI